MAVADFPLPALMSVAVGHELGIGRFSATHCTACQQYLDDRAEKQAMYETLFQADGVIRVFMSDAALLELTEKLFPDLFKQKDTDS